MLLKNIGEAEIQQLNYERYKYPCPIIQKRIHAVYLKATIGMTNSTIGKIIDLHRDTVGRWIRVYERDGFDALCQYYYGTNKSELEPHATGILKSFAEWMQSSKEVITLCNTTYINAQTIVDFLMRIKERYADKPVKIVLDNARYQHCKFVEETAKGLGIELLFLPSYSPNLNIIERLWKFTKRKILYAKYYDTPAKFHSAITGFFNDVSSKYKEDLKNLLTLKFQYFDNYSAEIYAE